MAVHALALGAGWYFVSAPAADSLAPGHTLSFADAPTDVATVDPPLLPPPPDLAFPEAAVVDPVVIDPVTPEPEVFPEVEAILTPVEDAEPDELEQALDPLSPRAAQRNVTAPPPVPPVPAAPPPRPQSPSAPATPPTVASTVVASAARGALRPLYRPAPAYPEALRRAGIEGVTVLRLVIESDGRVVEVNVVRSSGHEALDAAAQSTARLWRFEAPGERRTADAVPFRFRLT